MRCPGTSVLAAKTGVPVALAAARHVHVLDRPRGRRAGLRRRRRASSGASDLPTASTDTASAMSARSGMRKLKRVR